MNRNLSVVTYNVFGTYNEGRYIEDRCDYIINEIFKNGNPDIICLQEATEIIINNIIKKYLMYKSWTKVDTIDLSILNSVYKNELINDGYMVILYNCNTVDIIKKYLVYEGTRSNKGIMKIDIKFLNNIITVYNVHATGGTFGKSDESILRKKMARVNELNILNNSIIKDMENGRKDIIIMGDFNYDSNDMEHYDEGTHSPEHNINYCYDIWTLLRYGEKGSTEDEVINTFRSCMKIKNNKDKRECRYDKIISIMNNIKPYSIELIGNKEINKEVTIIGKDKYNNIYTNKCKLFPSDHFGLYCAFFII